MLRKVAVSTLSQALAKVVHLALNVVASLVLIRYLGPGQYGDYVFVLAFAALVGLASDLGLGSVAARDAARSGDAEGAIVGSALALRLGLAVASAVLAQALLAALGSRPQLRLAVAVASLLFVTEALLTTTVVFQVRIALQYEALTRVVIQGVETAILLLLVAHGAGLVPLVAASVAGAAVGVALAAALVAWRFPLRLRWEPGRVAGLLNEALPVGVNLLLAVVYLRLDTVLLGVLRTPRDVGIYAAAYKPVEYLLLSAAVLVNTLFPMLSRWHATDPARFAAVYQRGTQVLIAAALPVPVLAILAARPVVELAYTPVFAPAAVPLEILGVALVLLVFNGWQGFVLLAAGRQRWTLAYNAAGLVVNAVANVALIWWLGYLGAALAALVTALFIAACSVGAGIRTLELRPALGTLAPVAAAACVLGAVGLGLELAGLPWWAAVAGGGLAYLAALVVCRAFTLGEVRLLLAAAEPAEPLPVAAA